MTVEADFINTPEAQHAAIDQRDIIAGTAEVGIIRDNQFKYFAAFDGTSNSLIPSNGDPQNTNVAQLYSQALSASNSNPNIKAGYQAGPGTEGTLTASAWLSSQVTKQVIIAAEAMYEDFNFQASSWIQNNSDPDVRANPGDYITTAVTAFSRGVASAAIFSQLIAARGVTDPETGKTLIPPGEIGVSSGVIFDPVTTGVSGNLAFANSENILVLEAGNEYRYLFKSTDYSQEGVQSLKVIGNHCNVGGCYDNSLGALYLEGATKFLQLSGLSIAGVDPSRQFDPTERMVVYDEVGSYDSSGHLVRQWDTSGSYKTGDSSQPQRLTDPKANVHPSQVSYQGNAVTETFTMYNGATISNIKTTADTSLGNISTTDVTNLINGASTNNTSDSLSGLTSGSVNTPFFNGNSATNSSFGAVALVRGIAGLQSGGESWGGQSFIGASTVGVNVPAFNPASSYGVNLASAIKSEFSIQSPYISGFGQGSGTIMIYVGDPVENIIVMPIYNHSFDFPIVLDLNQNGIELINQDQSTAFFDYTDSGYRSHTGWVSANDGFLIFDSNNNDKADRAKELVLSQWTESSDDTDLDALKAVFDTNHDNFLNQSDDNFAYFKVWQDKNSDGVSDEGELKTLLEIGITSLNLNAASINWSSGGNKVSSLGQFTRSDGTTSTFADTALGHDADGWKVEDKVEYRLLTKADGKTYAIANGVSGLTLNVAKSKLSSAIGSVGADKLFSTGTTAVMLQGKGGNDVITGGAGDDWLEGGEGGDTISGGAGDDTIFVDGSDKLTGISGGDGWDTLVIQGNIGFSTNLTSLSMEYAVGGSGNDNLRVNIPDIRPNFQSTILFGSGGNDILYGAAGNDILGGGMGNDILYGDWGQDTYIFNKGDGRDVIYDYTNTTINYVDYTLMTGEFTREDWSLAQSLIGSVVFNSWLNGKDRLQPLASLTSGNARDVLRMGNNVFYSDIVIKYSGNNLSVGIREDGIDAVSSLADVVTVKDWKLSLNTVETIQFYDGRKFSIGDLFIGSSAANSLRGNSSNNLLSGLAGADTMSGGLGNDIYTVDDSMDIVIEPKNQGIDLVESVISYSLTNNVENLILIGSLAINGAGNQLNNRITGNRNNNILSGADGFDILNGGDGADTLIGGNGDDIYIVDGSTDTIVETSDGGKDTVESSVTYSLGNFIENLTLTGPLNVNGFGNLLNNVIKGNSGDNTLNGWGGKDTLIGGSGNDIYIVDSDTDIIVENLKQGTDEVYSHVNYTLGKNIENLTLIGVDAVIGKGNSLNNSITGNELDNILDGGAGVDWLVGGNGNDRYIVDNISDNILETVNGGVDTVQSGVSFVLGATSNVENLTLSGAVQINGTGNALTNFLLGNAANNKLTDIAGGNDVLQGMGGNDTLIDTVGNNFLDGGIGADTLNAGDGNDLLIGGKNNDAIATGKGSDLILFNKGDGADNILASAGSNDTLSLGGGFAYSDISLTKSANNLILKVGASDQITFKGWYETAANNKSIVNLQVIAEAVQGFSLGSSDTLRNNRVETFNFSSLVAAFDAVGAKANWQLTDTRLIAHLSAGSDSAAIGGDIAYKYGKAGSLTGADSLAARVLNNSPEAQTAQAFHLAPNWPVEIFKPL
jgi:Ca2+-binding RTX toxin-like protein